MRPRTLRPAPLLLVAAFAGCNATATTSDASTADVIVSDVTTVDLGAPDVPPAADVPPAVDVPPAADVIDASVAVDAPASPIEAPDRTWTWVDVAGAVCDDDTPTGMGVNLAAGATGTLVFLAGGGYCFDYATCYTLNTATHGPFNRPQFEAVQAQLSSSIFDRTLAGNPFAGFNLVLVPYCTGDLHAGDGPTTYTGSGAPHVHQYVGRRNLRAVLQRLARGLAPQARVVLAGGGAGGFGAVLNHDLAREAFPSGAMAVVDDSGPLLIGDAIPAAQRAAWFTNWHLGWLDASCPGCRTDLSAIHGALAARFPNDRTALVVSLQDAVNRSYFMQSAADYEAAVRALGASFAARPERRVFAVPGTSTALLRTAQSVSAADGTVLLHWLDTMVTGAAGWTSRGL